MTNRQIHADSFQNSLERAARAPVACIACAILLGPVAGTAWAADDSSLLDALENTQPLIDTRVRYEDVGQYGKPDSAEAVTVRVRIGFETGKLWGTSLLAEGVALTPLSEDYNSTINHKTQYPIVADPETYGLNRLALVNTSLPQTTLTIGRQRMNLDDQRFVGSSNWRQLEETVDAVRIVNKSIPDVTLDLTYLNRVNRVFGKNSPVGTYRGDNYLANASCQTPIGKLVGFVYSLDLDLAPTDSTRTYGARLSDSRKIGEFDVGYAASYARQHENANNPLRFTEDYYDAELSAGLSGYTVGAGVEILGGNGVKGFTTPLATLHKFQGWVDEFLVTPPNGIDDRFVSGGYGSKALEFLDSWSATVVYHDFHSERMGIAYGSEINAMLQGTRGKFSALLAYGDYTARHFATDTHKFWLEVDYVL